MSGTAAGRLTLLRSRGGIRLAKIHTWLGSSWETQDYGRAKTFDVGEASVEDLVGLYRRLVWLEGQSTVCVIRGQLRPGVPSTAVPRLLHDREGDSATFEPPWNALAAVECALSRSSSGPRS